MCGIVAHVAFDDSARIREETLEALNQLLIHRGPDSKGIYLKGDVGLAMRRLSIIDIEGGQQPMSSEDGRYTVVFNGEIYNHGHLRKDLMSKGYPLRTRSDTEVLLYAFIDQGVKCLTQFNGMFAFAIWDDKEQSLFVARDRMGIKPLYYASNGRRILFSSEITPIYRSGFFPVKINVRAVSDYLSFWYLCEPETILEDVYQLPPAHYAVIQNGKMKTEAYWKMPAEEDDSLSFEQCSEKLSILLEDAIKLRMKVDVPIGTFLSGGIDSGLVTTIAAKYINERLKSFSIGFKEKTYSELKEAAQTAQKYGVELYTHQIGDLEPQMLEKIFTAFDEPLGNASYVPTYFLAQSAAEHVKVVLTGDGGDELFGGYPTYQAPYYQTLYQKTPRWLSNVVLHLAGKLPVSHKRISFDYRIKQLKKGIDLPYTRAHSTWREVTPVDIQRNLFHPEIQSQLGEYDPFTGVDKFFQQSERMSIKNQLMYADLNTYLLNDHLRKIDRMGMAHSIEARVPFLDHRIVEHAVRMPADYKVTLFMTKRILRSIAKSYLPRSVINGKKKGLTSPIASWIFHDHRDYVTSLLKGGLLGELFNPQAVETVLAEHFRKEKDNSRTIWGLVTLQGWSQNLKKTNTLSLV